MSKDLEALATDLDTQMRWAQAVTVTVPTERGVAPQSILPNEYRGNPANVLIAIGLGASMGLSFAESLYRIAVIKGKPSAGAELIAANVRKAGHKLRVRGDETSCTATIIRADDPDFEFAVTRDLAWAKGMGLASNDNYRRQPGTMLQWRAITAVARQACPEALYGVTYTPDEISETGATAAPAAPSRPVGLAAVQAAVDVAPEPVAAVDEPVADVVHDADIVEEDEPAEPAPSENGAPAKVTAKTRARLFAMFADRNITDRDEQLRGIHHITGHQIKSRSEMTEDDALAVIAVLEAGSHA